jgi:cytochrome c553
LKPRPGYTKVIETDMVQVVEKLDDNDMIALSAYAGPEAQKASGQVR